MASERAHLDNSAFLPVPAAVLTFGSGCDPTRFLTVNWFGMTSRRPPLFSASFRATREAFRSLGKCEEFVLNLPTDDMLLRPEIRRGLAAARGPARVEGFSLYNDANFPGAFIAECPVGIACRRISLRSLLDQGVVRGEVVALFLKGSFYGEERAIDFCRGNRLSVSAETFPQSSSTSA